MCNRYKLRAKPDEFVAYFGALQGLPREPIVAEFFPGKSVPVIVQAAEGRMLQEMTWGFPPFKGSKPINNTRAETAATSAFWKRHLGTRCVFPLSEAIEWQHRTDEAGRLRKVPHSIGFSDGCIGAVAGIWAAKESGAVCSMLTCHANRAWAEIHNANPGDPRMVCFLRQREDVEAWLDGVRPFADVAQRLGPLPDERSLLAIRPLAANG
ncbi:MAG: SOS response-associated peptidase [Planctomycetes bacterium]|nr:SOS response-associated peptidase [Planctomycetota bacterium]